MESHAYGPYQRTSYFRTFNGLNYDWSELEECIDLFG